MLRSPQRAQQSSLSEQAWQTYLDDHFCPPGEVQDSRPSPSDMAVRLGRGQPPPAQLLANGAATGWFPLPDSIPAPNLGSMCSLLAEHLKRLKGSSSFGLDMVATPFLKYVVRYVPRAEGRGFMRSMFFCPSWPSSSCCLLRVPGFQLIGKLQEYPRFTRRAPCLTPTAIACWRLEAPCTDCSQMSFAPC